MDFRGAAREDAYTSLISQVLQRFQESPENLLVLYNFQDITFPPGVVEAIAGFAKTNGINPVKAAFVGMSKINVGLIIRLDRFLSDKTKRKLFQSEEEAKEWLALPPHTL